MVLVVACDPDLDRMGPKWTGLFSDQNGSDQAVESFRAHVLSFVPEIPQVSRQIPEELSLSQFHCGR